jgi:hypothetical protein
VVSKEDRQRSKGAGKAPRLKADDLLVMILVYFRVYPTQDMLGLLFEGGQSWACKWIHRLTPVIEAALGTKKQLPVRGGLRESLKGRRPVSTIEELLKICPELEFIIDGTERPIRRPKDSQKQRAHYSGKKKRHTTKHTVVSDKRGRKVIFMGTGHPGSNHDKTMADEDVPAFPDGSALWRDTGYQGFSPQGVNRTFQPRKKAKGKERSEEDKAYNREVSRTRVLVEHSIGGIKRSHIVDDIFRNRKEGFEDAVMFVAAGLHNYRMEMRAMT